MGQLSASIVHQLNQPLTAAGATFCARWPLRLSS